MKIRFSWFRVSVFLICVFLAGVFVFVVPSEKPSRLLAVISESVLVGASLVVAFVLKRSLVHPGIPTGLLLISLSVYMDLLQSITGLMLFETLAVALSVMAVIILLYYIVLHVRNLRIMMIEHEIIINDSNIGVILRNLKDNSFRFNEAARRILGYEPEELKSLSIYDIVLPQDLGFHDEMIERVMKGEAISPFEARYAGKNRKQIDVQVSASLVKNGKGIPDYIMLAFRDITRIKAMELSLMELNKFHRALNEVVTEALESGFDDNTYHDFLFKCVEAFPGADAGIFLLKEEDERFHYVAACNYDFEELKKVSFATDELIQANSDRVMVIKDYAVDYEMDDERQRILLTAGRLREIKSTITIPILIDGKVMMYFNLDSLESSTAFDNPEIQEIAASFGRAVAVLLSRLRLERELNKQRELLEKLSLEDPLTGLPNRRYFFDYSARQIEYLRRMGEEMTILYLDLNDFKGVNDTMGHDFGDELLKEVGKRLNSICRSSDLIARMGGDEFVYVLPSTGKEEAAEVIKRIRNSFKEPFIVENKSIYLSTSIGVALFPEDGKSVRELLIVADERMYSNKGRTNGKTNKSRIEE